MLGHVLLKYEVEAHRVYSVQCTGRTSDD